MQTSQPAAVPVTPKAFRSGTVTLLLTDLTKTVTFSSAMPSTSYSVHFEQSASIAVVLGVANKTTSGFDVLSTGIATTAKYKAIED